MRSELIDLTGQRFGRLTVIRKAPENYHRVTLHPDGHKVYTCMARWECKCDCGGTKTVIGINLKNGRTKSCGCIAKERCRALAAARKAVKNE